MPIYRTCPYCGAHLDPNEYCECAYISDAEHAEIERQAEYILYGEKRAAPKADAANSNKVKTITTLYRDTRAMSREVKA